ncbi:choice-of-anchor A family protein [Streptomyces sp. NPDC047981]|uniref:choice-of-anchor A family protein n=1 Tax=Streptomyces sp. NPDC047981 TaxID=3154610 RepID=UPI00344AB9B6
MRTPAAAAAVLAVTGTALLWAPAASAAPTAALSCAPLGVAGGYAEFVEKDSTRFSDSEGAVAVGGDARFGDAATGQGFSVGSRLSDADLAKLPGGHSLVVGGTLHANQVVVSKGSAVYGRLQDRSSADFAVDGRHGPGASPVDFGKEFAALRNLSSGWAAVTPNGTVAVPQGSHGLLLAGTDKELNVFAVAAGDLEKAAEISIKVPAGATTLVNVIGGSYDMGATPTYGVNLWDETAGRFVQDDYAAGSAAFKQVRSALLWNFPQAESVKKNYTSWPGTILAPRATVELGGKGVGPGHVNGAVVAEELLSVPGAETHQMTFTGCLPKAAEPGEPVTPEKPKPTPTVVPEQPEPEEPKSEQPGGTEPGAPSASPSTPAESAAPGTPAPAPTTPEGDLASTGSAFGPGVVGVAIATVALGGGFVAYSVRRRRGRLS